MRTDEKIDDGLGLGSTLISGSMEEKNLYKVTLSEVINAAQISFLLPSLRHSLCYYYVKVET